MIPSSEEPRAAASDPQAALIAFAVRRPGIIMALALALAFYGLVALQSAKYDVFPEFAPPTVTVQTEAPGLNPEQVEVLVTQAVEVAISGLPRLATMRSNSIQGLSVVAVTFEANVDILQARQLVNERIAAIAAELPQGVAPPAMTALTSSTSTALLIGLTSSSRSLMDVRTIADWRVRLRLLAAPGVGEILIYGGDIRSIRIQVRPQDLIRFRIGLEDVVAAGRKATGVRGAGFVDTTNQRITLQTEGQSLTPEAVARTVLINEGGASVTIGDVADVVNAPEPAISAGAIDGKRGVLMMIGAQYGANTLEVTANIEAALAELRPGLERDGIELRADLFRPADFIAQATGNVLQALALGGVLVVVVLLIFLFDWRTALISATAIPLSLIGAVLVLEAFGQSLNTMTLGGLAIAIGEVVDDAVIGVENVMRRLRENRRLATPKPEMGVVLDAIMEVRVSVAYATFAVLLVFLPVIALTGVPGRLFGPLALAYILAVLVSLVVALTVTPAMARLLLVKRKTLPSREPPVTRGARSVYVGALKRFDRFPRLVIGTSVVIMLAGAALTPFFGGAFLPELKEGQLILHTALAPGTSLEETLRFGERITAGLKAVEGVRAVAQQSGRAEAGYDLGGTHESEIYIALKRGLDGEQQEKAEADIRQLMATTPGASFSLKTFLTERIEEVVSGFTAPVVVSVYGSDLDKIEAAARDVAREVAEVRGAVDVQLKSSAGLPQVNVTLRPNDLRHWGLDSIQVLEAVRTAYQGDVVGQTYEGNAVFNVVVELDRPTRTRITALKDLPLKTQSGTFIRLAHVADVYETPGRYAVGHIGAQRVRVVTANVEDRDIASFTAAVKRKIEREVKLPSGVYVGLGGAAEAQSKATRDLLLYSGLAGLGIVLLLAIVTGSFANLVLVLANIPFAFVGGVIAVAATGAVMSLGSIVGFVTLFGISLRNTIMLIAHYEHLVIVEKRTWDASAAIDGAADRLVPILMTSLVTGLGLLPLALGAGEPGREIEGPMAQVILGGLASSTILNLLLLPMLAKRFARFRKERDLESNAPSAA